MGRWLSTDPAGQYWSHYVGMGNNPVSGIDPDGAYTWLGAWVRNGFSRNGLVNSGGEWGLTRYGNTVTDYGYSELGDKIFEFSYTETYTDFGEFGTNWGDQHAYFTSANYRHALDILAFQNRPLATGAAEPVYPETYFMPTAPIKGLQAGRSLYAARTTLSQTKKALAQVHKLLGGSLPKGEPGKFGSPQRGNSKKGYRLDPAHPNRPAGHSESVPHINYWDYTKGKRGSGGVSGAIPIISPK